MYEFIFCTYEVKTFHALSGFTFAQTLYFWEVIFPVLVVYWIKTPEKKNREEDFFKTIAQNRASEKRKDVSLYDSKCLCHH